MFFTTNKNQKRLNLARIVLFRTFANMKSTIFFLSFLFAITIVKSQTNARLQVNCEFAPFYHGVASGDPLSSAVVIWTRVTPDTNFLQEVEVYWRVATDTLFNNIVSQGVYNTDQDKDFTVKVDVQNLEPNTFYYYDFYALNARSIVGRTKTAPVGNTDSLRFAVFSCAHYESGFFNAYRVAAKRNDFDAVIHLGDYIYEYSSNGGVNNNPNTDRNFEPSNEIITLYDYRTRYAHYKLDEDLMRLHQNYPWLVVWDDHEFANDAYTGGAENHTQGAEGDWEERKAYAKQAYFEWMPIRETPEVQSGSIFRKVSYGDLCDLILIDTRIHGRDEQVPIISSAVNDPDRTILGDDQMAWLQNELGSSTAKWKVVSQQILMAPLKILNIPIYQDFWDDYKADRNKLFSFVQNNSIDNFVVLTGDIHFSLSNDLPSGSYNSNGSGSVGVEFVVPSVTSLQFPINESEFVVKLSNSHIKYIDMDYHGFYILDLNEERAQADYYFVNTLDYSSDEFFHDASWKTLNGGNHLEEAETAGIPRAQLNFPQAPLCPLDISLANPTVNNERIEVMGIYPTLYEHSIYLNGYAYQNNLNVDVSVYSNDGKQVYQTTWTIYEKGVFRKTFDLSFLNSGLYYLRFNDGVNEKSYPIIKK